MIATVDEDGTHGLSYMVHAKILVPKPSPVIVVLGESELVIIPDPDTKLHCPIPELAILPAIRTEGEEMQMV